MDGPEPFSNSAKSTPTIRDVAHRAGVSPATVSNVLSGKPSVTSSNRALVVQAAAELGYKSNYMASSLRRGRTRTIGVVVPNLANEFFSRLVTYWEALSTRAGYEILVVATQDEVETERQRIQSIVARRVDGLLVASALDDFGSAKDLASSLPPTVLVDRAFGCAPFDTVASNNFQAGKLGTCHLLALGHRDIALVTSADSHLHLRARIDGYRSSMTEAGLTDRIRIVIGGQSVEDCRGAVEQELRRPDPPTAIFATTFFSTLGAVKAIRALNIAFPEEMSLVAFEQSEWMTVFRPYLTSVSQQSDQLAAVSWDLLMKRIDGTNDAPQHIKVPVHLTIRESARATTLR